MKNRFRFALAWLVMSLTLVPSASAGLSINGVDLLTATADDYLEIYPDEVGGNEVFSDIPSDHWAFPYLGSNAPLITSEAVDSDESLYSCNEPATRAETVKIISILFRIPEYEDDDLEFDDVSTDAWYAPYLKNLVSLGVINGYSDGTFRPEAQVTRAESVKILAALMYESTGWMGEDPFSFENYMEIEHINSEPESFTDVNENDWFYTYVDLFSRGSLADGYEDGTFRPNANVTRCELAKLAGQSYFVFKAALSIIQSFTGAFTEQTSSEDLLEHFWQEL